MANNKDQARIQIHRFTQNYDAHSNMAGVLRSLGGRQLTTLSGPINEPHWLDLKNNTAQITIFKNNQWVSTGITAEDGVIYEGDDPQNGDIKSTEPISIGDVLVVLYGTVFFTEGM